MIEACFQLKYALFILVQYWFIDNGCSSEKDSVWKLDWPCTQAGATAVANCPNSAEGTYVCMIAAAKLRMLYGVAILFGKICYPLSLLINSNVKYVTQQTFEQ